MAYLDNVVNVSRYHNPGNVEWYRYSAYISKLGVRTRRYLRYL
jgi:hypothetical protein